MTASAVSLFKMVSEAIQQVSCPGWTFEAGSLADAIFVRAWPADCADLQASRMFFVSDRATRLDVARLCADAAKSCLMNRLYARFAVSGQYPFARTGD